MNLYTFLKSFGFLILGSRYFYETLIDNVVNVRQSDQDRWDLVEVLWIKINLLWHLYQLWFNEILWKLKKLWIYKKFLLKVIKSSYCVSHLKFCSLLGTNLKTIFIIFLPSFYEIPVNLEHVLSTLILGNCCINDRCSTNIRF